MSASSGHVPPVPSVLRLVQRSVLGRWRATGEELYREVAELLEIERGREILVSGCGDGITTEWLARRTGALVTGVDPVRERVERAEERARSLSRPLPLQYVQAPLDDLPHESEVFDAAVGEPTLSAASDPERAVAELARVTKPMGPVVLLQLTWSSDIQADARERVVERLGLRPYLLVEWKQMLRDAGIVDLQVQDWTTGGDGSERSEDEDEPRLGWREKMHIVGRTWRRGGWREARGAVAREARLLQELSRERALGFALLKGVKWPRDAKQ
ncbi:MAG TPA: methyltransferase domain-containing protein [Gemmatimonadales bacterium]